MKQMQQTIKLNFSSKPLRQHLKWYFVSPSLNWQRESMLSCDACLALPSQADFAPMEVLLGVTIRPGWLGWCMLVRQWTCYAKFLHLTNHRYQRSVVSVGGVQRTPLNDGRHLHYSRWFEGIHGKYPSASQGLELYLLSYSWVACADLKRCIPNWNHPHVSPPRAVDSLLKPPCCWDRRVISHNLQDGLIAIINISSHTDRCRIERTVHQRIILDWYNDMYLFLHEPGCTVSKKGQQLKWLTTQATLLRDRYVSIH